MKEIHMRHMKVINMLHMEGNLMKGRATGR